MTLHAYRGPGHVYPSLATGDADAPTVAPFTLADGDVVDFGEIEPPADGNWKTTTKRKARRADNYVEAVEVDEPVDEPLDEDPPASDPDPAVAGDPQE